MKAYDITTGVFLTATDVWAELFKCKGTYDMIKVTVAVRSSASNVIGFADCRIITNSGLIVLDADYNNTLKFRLLKDNDNYYHFYAKSTYNSSYLSASVEYMNSCQVMEIYPISEPKLLPDYTDVSIYSISYNHPKSISIASLWTAVPGWSRITRGQVQYRDRAIYGTIEIEGSTSSGTVPDDTQIGILPKPIYTNTESLYLQVVAFYTDSEGLLKPCLARINGNNGSLTVLKVGNDCGSSTRFYVPLNYVTTFSDANTLFKNNI